MSNGKQQDNSNKRIEPEDGRQIISDQLQLYSHLQKTNQALIRLFLSSLSITTGLVTLIITLISLDYIDISLLDLPSKDQISQISANYIADESVIHFTITSGSIVAGAISIISIIFLLQFIVSSLDIQNPIGMEPFLGTSKENNNVDYTESVNQNNETLIELRRNQIKSIIYISFLPIFLAILSSIYLAISALEIGFLINIILYTVFIPTLIGLAFLIGVFYVFLKRLPMLDYANLLYSVIRRDIQFMYFIIHIYFITCATIATLFKYTRNIIMSDQKSPYFHYLPIFPLGAIIFASYLIILITGMLLVSSWLNYVDIVSLIQGDIMV